MDHRAETQTWISRAARALCLILEAAYGVASAKVANFSYVADELVTPHLVIASHRNTHRHHHVWRPSRTAQVRCRSRSTTQLQVFRIQGLNQVSSSTLSALMEKLLSTVMIPMGQTSSSVVDAEEDKSRYGVLIRSSQIRMGRCTPRTGPFTNWEAELFVELSFRRRLSIQWATKEKLETGRQKYKGRWRAHFRDSFQWFWEGGPGFRSEMIWSKGCVLLYF